MNGTNGIPSGRDLLLRISGLSRGGSFFARAAEASAEMPRAACETHAEGDAEPAVRRLRMRAIFFEARYMTEKTPHMMKACEITLTDTYAGRHSSTTAMIFRSAPPKRPCRKREKASAATANRKKRASEHALLSGDMVAAVPVPQTRSKKTYSLGTRRKHISSSPQNSSAVTNIRS